MKIVFIHGAQQQHIDAPGLKSRWQEIFQLGLDHFNLTLPIAETDLVFPFYGDLLLKHAPTPFNTPLKFTLPQSLKDWHLPYLHPRADHQSTQGQAFIPLLAEYQAQLTLAARAYHMSNMVKDHVLHGVVQLLNQFPKLHENILHHYVSEVDLYLANADFMHDVNKRVLESFEDDEDYIVVSHSLGTIVAYNLLQHLPPSIKIRRFITLASPLAFHIIQSRLQPLDNKPTILQGDWYNFYSQEDYLTTLPLDHQFFKLDPAIVNWSISTFANKPHEIIGYLQHPTVIHSILESVRPRLSLPL